MRSPHDVRAVGRRAPGSHHRTPRPSGHGRFAPSGGSQCRRSRDGAGARGGLPRLDADDGIAAMVLWAMAARSARSGPARRGGRLGCRGLQAPTGAADDPFGPMGPTRLRSRQAGDRGRGRPCGRGRARTALWCDLRIAEEDAVFGVFCRRWGCCSSTAEPCLPRVIGQGRALDMILTGRAVRADEALSFGLANRVVPRGGHVPRRKHSPR